MSHINVNCKYIQHIGPNTTIYGASVSPKLIFMVMYCACTFGVATTSIGVAVDFCYSTAGLFHVLYDILYYAHTCLRHIFHFEGFVVTHIQVLSVNGLLASKKTCSINPLYASKYTSA